MSASLYTIILSFIWLNVFIVISSVLKSRRSFMRSFGVAPLIVLLVLGAVRFFFPFEFPFTQVVRSQEFMPAVQSFMRTVILEYKGMEFTVFHVLAAIWTTVSAALLVRIGVNLCRQQAYLSRLGDDDPRLRTILDKIIAEKGRKDKIKVVCSPDVPSPLLSGIFTSAIILPPIELDDKKLEFVLRHEYSHYLQRDIWIKLFVKVFTAVFWWNPFVYILKPNLDDVLELRCDDLVTKGLDEEGRLSYVEAVKDAVKLTYLSKVKQPAATAALFSSGNTNMLAERLHIVLSRKKRTNRAAKIAVSGLLLALIVFSYGFVLQPEAYPVDPDNNFITITPQNAYIKLEDGEYILYVNGERFITIDENDLNAPPHNQLKIIR